MRRAEINFQNFSMSSACELRGFRGSEYQATLWIQNMFCGTDALGIKIMSVVKKRGNKTGLVDIYYSRVYGQCPTPLPS